VEILFVVREGLERFEEETVNRLKGISGLYDVSDSTIGDCLSASFDFDDDSTMLRLAGDFQRISITGTGPASRELVLLVRRALEGLRLRVFDIDFSFDAELVAAMTSEDLQCFLEGNAKS